MQRTFLLLIVTVSVLLFSCKDQDKPSNEELLLGTWMFESAEATSTINDQDAYVYYKDVLGYSEEQIQEIRDSNAEELASISLKSWIFSDDFTFESFSEDELDYGNWGFTQDGKGLVMNEEEFDVLELSKSRLELNLVHHLFLDFDEDGEDDEWVIQTQMNFNK